MRMRKNQETANRILRIIAYIMAGIVFLIMIYGIITAVK